MQTCVKIGEPRVAVKLLEEQIRAGMRPSVEGYTYGVQVCSDAGMWEKALSFFDRMRGVAVPDELP